MMRKKIWPSTRRGVYAKSRDHPWLDWPITAPMVLASLPRPHIPPISMTWSRIPRIWLNILTSVKRMVWSLSIECVFWQRLLTPRYCSLLCRSMGLSWRLYHGVPIMLQSFPSREIRRHGCRNSMSGRWRNIDETHQCVTRKSFHKTRVFLSLN